MHCAGRLSRRESHELPLRSVTATAARLSRCEGGVSRVFKIANGFARRCWHLLSTCNLLASATKLAPGPFLCGSAAAGRSAIRSRIERGGEMFERFTDRARRVVVVAQEEARILNHNYIGTEHLLLGLIRESEGVAAKAL